MACGNNVDSAALSDHFVVCESCDEGAEARKHCDECLSNFCDRCARTHRKLTGRERHRIEPGVCRYNMELELCSEDGQKMSFFCESCGLRVCPECELRRKLHVFHVVVPLDKHLGCEKERLLDRLDDVTTKTETISYLPQDIKAMATQIELKWLERKELMRQEFASLLETITAQQQKLMADMEEEVKSSLQRLEKLQQAHETVLSTTCQFSDDCITAVQNLPRDEFLKSYPQFLESAKSVVNQVERMSSPDDCMPSFLQLPFSLHKEKVHLHHCLQLSAYDCQHMKAIEYNRFIPHSHVKEEIAVNMLVNCPERDNVPPSCTIQYRAEVFCGSKQSKQKPAWVNPEPLSSTDVMLNGSHGFQLAPGMLYLVKIHPEIRVSTHQGDTSFDGKVVSIVIVTESDAEADVVRGPSVAADGGQSVADTTRLLDANNGGFVGEAGTLAYCNLAGAGDQNNNSTSRMSDSHSINNSIISSLNSVGHLIGPVLQGAFQVPNVSGGFLRLHGGSQFESSTVLDQTFFDKDFDSDLEKAKMKCQKRYVSICSFEEARLLEDMHLKV